MHGEKVKRVIRTHFIRRWQRRRQRRPMHALNTKENWENHSLIHHRAVSFFFSCAFQLEWNGEWHSSFSMAWHRRVSSSPSLGIVNYTLLTYARTPIVTSINIGTHHHYLVECASGVFAVQVIILLLRSSHRCRCGIFSLLRFNFVRILFLLLFTHSTDSNLYVCMCPCSRVLRTFSPFLLALLLKRYSVEKCFERFNFSSQSRAPATASEHLENVFVCYF